MMASLEVKVYKRRWWILFLFAGMGFMQVKYHTYDRLFLDGDNLFEDIEKFNNFLSFVTGK